MHSFTIRDIEHLTGIRAHTIRIWEQRYGLVKPGRKESHHRQYSTEDLKSLLRISLLYHQGHKISRLAAMSASEMDELILASGRQGDHYSLINQMMEASIDLDEGRFKTVLQGLYDSIGIEQAIIRVVYPYFEKIGLLWMTGNVIPAQEHFASNLIRNWLLVHMPDPEKNTHEEPVLLICPPGEHHEIPLLFIQFLLRQSRRQTVNFGANTPLEYLQAWMDKQHEGIILVYLITNFVHDGPKAYLEQILRAFPDRQVIAAGPAFREVDLDTPRVKVMRTLQELMAFAKNQERSIT